MNKSKKIYLDQEEKDLENAIDQLDFSTLQKPTIEEQRIFKKVAKEFVKKESKMNIRIDPMELSKIKERAKIEGLRYSTFVKSILHKYLTGQLVEKK